MPNGLVRYRGPQVGKQKQKQFILSGAFHARVGRAFLLARGEHTAALGADGAFALFARFRRRRATAGRPLAHVILVVKKAS